MALTPAVKAKQTRDRKKAAGLVKLELWVKPEVRDMLKKKYSYHYYFMDASKV